MIELNGIDIEFPFGTLEFVGTLLFTDYPSTVVYSDETDNPIIKEWVDCSDDNSINRFFTYKVEKENLKKFIEGTLSHLELINISGNLVFEDVKEHTIRTFIIPNIPKEYLPNADFYFKEILDIKIINYFNM